MAKNNIPAKMVEASKLLQKLMADGNAQILYQDVKGAYHFNGNFKNANDLKVALDALADTEYADLAQAERKSVLQTFEKVFNHKAFTGRSGTFFG
jgi:formiminotetrahydrofolate cyclodeaminase